MILGTMEGENALGGRLQKKYSCSVEAFGKQYVAETPSDLLIRLESPGLLLTV